MRSFPAVYFSEGRAFKDVPMGFWISIARPAGAEPPDRQEWLYRRPFDPDDLRNDDRYIVRNIGLLEVEDGPSIGYAVPWLAARLSWGEDEEEVKHAFGHLHVLADQLGMTVYGDEPLVPVDVTAAVKQHQNGRRTVVGLFGVARARS